jgi:excisionase family DNA binding protein
MNIAPPFLLRITFITNNVKHDKLYARLPISYTSGMPEEWMRTDEVAAELGVSKTVVWRQIDSGRLPAEKFGRDWRIRREDFEQFRTLRRERGRPRKADPPPPRPR